MRNIEVSVIHEAHECPAGMMLFLARLTQNGHTVKNMADLESLYNDSLGMHKSAKAIAAMPHGTIKRLAPITIAIVGGSRRFLAQARTHHVGVTFVSASLQYSDYSTDGDFVIPYEILEADKKVQLAYGAKCRNDIEFYADLISKGVGNDTAGYTMNQAMRNVLIMSANHEAWMSFIRLRACHRNTPETQYIALRVWEQLLKTADGEEMFAWTGPDCVHGKCREGKMSCGEPINPASLNGGLPANVIKERFPLIAGGDAV